MRNADQERAWEKRQLAIAMFLESLETGGGLQGAGKTLLVEVRILMNCRSGGETLLVAKASNGYDKLVGFVGGPNVGDALLAWRRKDKGKGLKWRQDLPWKDRP